MIMAESGCEGSFALLDDDAANSEHRPPNIAMEDNSGRWVMSDNPRLRKRPSAIDPEASEVIIGAFRIIFGAFQIIFGVSQIIF